tara:strand:- start:1890 stop:4289 length:2400 start_codon:yes stop_codon:yes gene_type:complete
MPTPTIIKAEEQFFNVIYEGNGGGQRVGNFVPFTDNGTIAKSCIFEDGDSAVLSKTFSGDGNRKKFTISVWFKRGNLGSAYFITSTGANSSNRLQISIESSNKLNVEAKTGGSTQLHLQTNRTFEDTSKWYHVLLSVDTDNISSSERGKLYIDGNRVTSFANETYPSQGADLQWNAGQEHLIGKRTYASTYYDGYLAEFNNVDGTAYEPSTFGLTDTSTGRWIPKTLSGITYGTNGFRLEFANSAGQTIGDDTSGNTNDFSVTNLVAGDITTDSPTQNHATCAVNGPNLASAFSEGNLKVTFATSSSMTGGLSTLRMVSGKYYMEVTVDSISSAGLVLGIMGSDRFTATNEFTGRRFDAYGYYSLDGKLFNDYDGNSTSFNFGNSYTTNDVIGIAVDLDNDKLYFSKNGTFQNSANPSAGTGGQSIISAKSTTAGFYRFCLTDGGTGSTDIVTANFGQKSFTHTPPTGFSALQQDNLPETGKGVPDFIWIKNRDATDSYQLYNSSVGPQRSLTSDDDAAETLVTDGLQKFLKGGMSIEDDDKINTSGESYVSWNWVCNGGTTTANTSATPTIASTIQANPTAGFSIVEYTGTGSAGTVEHGLSQAPEWVMVKSRSNDTGDGFTTYHVGMTSAAYYLRLHNTSTEASASTVWNSTAPTSSVVSIGTSTGVNTNTYTYLMYCWHSVSGYSKFGKYSGNGNANGPFIFLGFKPAWLLIKRLNGSNSWVLLDNTRSPFNPVNDILFPDTTGAEFDADRVDFYSNGFKLLNSGSGVNNSGGSFVYMAFAQHPFVGNGTSPTTAQ